MVCKDKREGEQGGRGGGLNSLPTMNTNEHQQVALLSVLRCCKYLIFPMVDLIKLHHRTRCSKLLTVFVAVARVAVLFGPMRWMWGALLLFNRFK
jgi:hypothetical protein